MALEIVKPETRTDREIVEFFSGEWFASQQTDDELARIANTWRRKHPDLCGAPDKRRRQDDRVCGATCVRTLTTIVRQLDETPDWKFDVDIARSGTAYVRLETPCGGALRDIRVSDHRCYAGAYSHDGRTDNYTIPDIEFRRGDKAADIRARMTELMTDMAEEAADWSLTED